VKVPDSNFGRGVAQYIEKYRSCPQVVRRR